MSGKFEFSRKLLIGLLVNNFFFIIFILYKNRFYQFFVVLEDMILT